MTSINQTLRYLVFLATTTIIGFAALGEIVLRIKGDYYTYSEKSRGIYVSAYSADEWQNWYGYIRKPNITTSYNLPEYDFKIETNSLGIRDIEHPIVKGENEVRIIGLGDSFTEGLGAAFKDGWLQQLEKKLNDNADSVKFTCISGGIYGIDPFIAYQLLTTELLKYDPDMVIVTINTSDIIDIMTRGGDERFLKNGKVQFWVTPKYEWIYAKSHLARFIMLEYLNFDALALRPEEKKQRKQNAVKLLQQKINDFNKLSIRGNFSLLVVIHPFSPDLERGAYDFDVDKIMEFCEQNNIQCLNLLNHFLLITGNNPDSIKKYYWSMDQHHNALGYKIFSEGVESKLKTSEILLH